MRNAQQFSYTDFSRIATFFVQLYVTHRSYKTGRRDESLLIPRDRAQAPRRRMDHLHDVVCETYYLEARHGPYNERPSRYEKEMSAVSRITL